MSQVVNNYDWYREMTFLGFLRDVGKHARMGTMLNKDSVKSRLTNDTGMSFTEFSYQLLQVPSPWPVPAVHLLCAQLQRCLLHYCTSWLASNS